MSVADGAESYLYGHDRGAQIAAKFAETLKLAIEGAELTRQAGGDGAGFLAEFADRLRQTADELDRQLGR